MKLSYDTKQIAGVFAYTICLYMTCFTLAWLFQWFTTDFGRRGYWEFFFSWGGPSRHGLGMFHHAMILIVIYGTGALLVSLYKDFKRSK